MKNTVSKCLRVLCSMVVVLTLMVSITSVPVLAISKGVYISTATPHYKHPNTGVIEDSGGEASSVLGQSMTESVLYKKALVEVESSGDMYVTLRLQLMGNIKNPKFSVDGSFISASCIREDYNKKTADYRMKINNENSVIRGNLYVIPMGRAVIFYVTVSDFKSGYGDFNTSMNDNNPKVVEKPKPAKKPKSAETTTAVKNPKKVESKPSIKEKDQINKDKVNPPKINESKVNETKINNGEATGSITSEEEDIVLGIKEFDDSGKQLKTDESVKDKDAKEKKIKTDDSSFGWWVTGGVVVLIIIFILVGYFCFFKKKTRRL